jgi:Family of unknown function (DUF6152)
MRVVRTFCAVLAVCCDLLVFARVAAAHHGSASYKTDAMIALKDVTVTQFVWANPHSMLLFDVKGDKSNVAHWAAEAGSPAAIRALGWNKYSVRPGDVITVKLYPSKFENNVGRIDAVVLPNGSMLKNTPRTDQGDISRY